MNRMQEKIIVAFQDNHKELLEARASGDFEEELLCKGYEQAMEFVMSLLGISSAEAMRKGR